MLLGKKKVGGLEDEFVSKKPKRKQSLVSKLMDHVEPQKEKVFKRAPITFNVGLAIILFLFYFSIMFVGGPANPMLFLLVIPTLYIIARYIRLERDHRGEQAKTK